MTMTSCPWCHAAFHAREKAGSPQRFCQAACRNAYHSACGRFADLLVKRGFIPIDDLRSWDVNGVSDTAIVSAVNKRARLS